MIFDCPFHLFDFSTQFAPWLELHHVVFVGESNSRKVYAVDYSPLNQRENIVNLLLGRYVPAEIRVRLLTAGQQLSYYKLR